MSNTNEDPRIQGDTGADQFSYEPTIEDEARQSILFLIDKGAFITPSEFYSLISETVIRWANAEGLTGPNRGRRMDRKAFDLIRNLLAIIKKNKGSCVVRSAPENLPPFMLAQFIAAEHRVVLVGEETDEVAKMPLMRYHASGRFEGTYREITEREGVRELLSSYTKTANSYLVNEVYAQLRSLAPMVSECTEPHLVPVDNGIYNVETRTLETFSPDRVYLTKCMTAYNPNAVSPTRTLKDGSPWEFNAWLADLFSGDLERVALVWQTITAALRVHKNYDKAVCFYSPKGEGGKGTLLVLLKELVGAGNWASVPLKKFSDRFGTEPLFGKSAVFTDENSVSVFTETASDLKQYITHEVITIDRKNQRAVQWRPRGVMVQCLNDLPEFADKTDSLWRRFAFLPFDKCFTGRRDLTIKDTFMRDPEVLEYVLKVALELPDFDDFIVGAKAVELGEDVKLNNDPVRAWWSEVGDRLLSTVLPVEFLFALFCAWFKKTNPSGRVISYRKFRDRLKSIVDGENPQRFRLMGRDENPISWGQYWTDEPVMNEYKLTIGVEWAETFFGNPTFFNNRPRGRGLVRLTSTTARTTDEDVQPEEQQPVLVADERISIAETATQEELHEQVEKAAAAFLGGQTA